MARYSASHQTAAGSTLTLLNLTGSAAIRACIYSISLGSDATPADLAGEFALMRTTTAGTGGTALNENPLDPLTVAGTAAATGGTYTAAPTVTANSHLHMFALNQRATYVYCTNPDAPFITAASANNGINIYSVNHGGTPNINCSISYWE